MHYPEIIACVNNWHKKPLEPHIRHSHACEVLAFLNSKRPGKRGFPATLANLRLIGARLTESDVQTCKSVVANRVRVWGKDDRMRSYIRVKTIFNATNFSNYVAELNDEQLS